MDEAMRERNLPAVLLHRVIDEGRCPIHASLLLTVYREAVALPVADPVAEYKALFAAHR
jgi:hypothetical protein